MSMQPVSPPSEQDPRPRPVLPPGWTGLFDPGLFDPGLFDVVEEVPHTHPERGDVLRYTSGLKRPAKDVPRLPFRRH